MLIDRFGEDVKPVNKQLWAGSAINGWSHSRIDLSDDISNYRLLIFEFNRTVGNGKGYIQVPVIDGTPKTTFYSEVYNNQFRYIELNIKDATKRSLMAQLLCWVNSSNNTPYVITGVYGVQ